ncbi:3771_t:CDS:2 [Gigaspora margarita]|uniref:3771_t:CDS:1 n=1 Tax=Gigaspora margarita TaxID=4874 RepID=A0ABM8VXR6_GIGMA|nr:3771_t:CDS:2 [Gigaspora margarita]
MSNKDLFKLSFGQEFEYASFENTTKIAIDVQNKLLELDDFKKLMKHVEKVRKYILIVDNKVVTSDKSDTNFKNI